jgi:hypothetical protein
LFFSESKISILQGPIGSPSLSTTLISTNVVLIIFLFPTTVTSFSSLKPVKGKSLLYNSLEFISID